MVAEDAHRRRVSYFYEPSIGDYYYGQGHPMKPHRIRMAHSLVVHYGLHRLLELSRPYPASDADIRRFHSDEYVAFLASATGNPGMLDPRAVKRFNVGEDCPVFDGLFPFCQASVGEHRRCRQAQPRGCRHRRQLGGRSPPRQEERCLRVLLRQRHRPRHPGAPQVP